MGHPLTTRQIPTRTFALGASLVFSLGVLSTFGCAGYHFGSNSLYPADIHTVYVPMFESDSFRRNLGEWLTEAVCKEIERKTPYKVVSTPNADSVLTGRIVSDSKKVIVEDQFDQPRESELNWLVQVSWADRKNVVIGKPCDVPIPASLVELSQSGKLVPEYGQSVVSSEQEIVERMARQIVALMEVPW